MRLQLRHICQGKEEPGYSKTRQGTSAAGVNMAAETCSAPRSVRKTTAGGFKADWEQPN